MRYNGFIGATFTGRAPTVACDRCINWYPTIIIGAGDPENRIILEPTPGLKLFATLPSPATKNEELYTDPKSGRVLAASDRHLYEISSTGVSALLGTIDAGPYSFASNPVGQVLISGGTTAHLLVGTTLSVPGGTFLGSSMVDYDDSYFVSLVPHSQKFQISGLLDGLTWSGLDFGSAIGSADDVRALKVVHKELWLFGKQRGEIYVDTGNPSFPFERLNGVYIEQGVRAARTLVKLDNTLFWLGENARGRNMVYRAEGYTPRRISTHAIEQWLADYEKTGTLDDAYAYGREAEGHHFYHLHCPSVNPVVSYLGYNRPTTTYLGASWVYDVTTNLWHEMPRWNTSTAVWERSRWACHTFGFGKHLVGDWSSGKIYEVSPEYFDDAGDVIRRVRVAPHINDEGKMIYYPKFRLNIQVGTGNPLDVDPHIDMRNTDDGGLTWSNPRSRSVGKQGEYKTRVQWDANGGARRRAFEVSTTMRAPCTLVDAYLPNLFEGTD